jgi:hypothetical protein
LNTLLRFSWQWSFEPFLFSFFRHLYAGLFGKRMAAQINRIEMVALYSLAAAIGAPYRRLMKGCCL